MLVYSVTAQNKTGSSFNKSISIITENDSYLFQGSDRYYTNGLFFQYRTAQIKEGRKNIQQFELGQKIFTPKRKFDANDLRFYSNGYPVHTIDRPFCGYLFIKYSNAQFLSGTKMYQWGITTGTIGRASGGEQTQELIHRVGGIYIPVGWENQVQHNALLNVVGSYTQQLLNKKVGRSEIRVIPTGTLNLGNINTNAQLSCNVAFGIMDDFENTALLNAEINNEAAFKKKYELFVYFQPGLTLQVYNATIQEHLFSKNPATDLKPFIYQHKIGAAYSKKRMTINIGYIFQTKELMKQYVNHRYASIQLSYQIR